MISYEEYKKAREWGSDHISTARQAVAHIRSLRALAERLPELDWEDRSTGVSVAHFTRDGWDIFIEVEPDYDGPELEKHGVFTETWRPGCLVNPAVHEELGRNRYCRTSPFWHYDQGCDGIREYASKQGVARHDAWLSERRARQQSMEWASGEGDLEYVGIIARACLMGVELGASSVWGVDLDGSLDDPYIRELAAEEADQALNEGKARLAKLLEAAR